MEQIPSHVFWCVNYCLPYILLFITLFNILLDLIIQYSYSAGEKIELCTTEDHLYTNFKVRKRAPDDRVNSEKPWGG